MYGVSFCYKPKEDMDQNAHVKEEDRRRQVNQWTYAFTIAIDLSVYIET